MSDKIGIIELHYFPSVAFFKTIFQYQSIELEACENFQKQTYRNRCYILTSNKVDLLSVPVLGGNNTPIKEVQIDYKQRWENRHWRAITSAYANAPFFEYYEDAFKELIYSKEEFLYDLNLKILKICLKFLGKSLEVAETPQFFKEIPPKYDDLRGVIHPKRENSLNFTPYYQVFGEKFVKNMSILDLLCCEGPNSIQFLKN